MKDVNIRIITCSSVSSAQKIKVFIGFRLHNQITALRHNSNIIAKIYWYDERLQRYDQIFSTISSVNSKEPVETDAQL